MDTQDSIPYGYCHCGCGQKTSLARDADKAKGIRRGDPMKYIAGHNRRLSPHEYLEEEAGFSTPCWMWQRGKFKNGYGATRTPGDRRKKYAHRVFYERAKGPIPEGLDLDHLCRNRACCNPDHLEPVTRQVNARRGMKTRLTLEQAREIKAARGKHTMRELGERFGVSISAVAGIWAGRTWKDA